jgi:hypothetical protein
MWFEQPEPCRNAVLDFWRGQLSESESKQLAVSPIGVAVQILDAGHFHLRQHPQYPRH